LHIRRDDGKRLGFAATAALLLLAASQSGCNRDHRMGKVHAAPEPGSGHVFFRVQAAHSFSGPVSGRVLVFVKPGSGDTQVDASEYDGGGVWIAAREVTNLAPGASVEVDGDETAFPKGLSAMPGGEYEAQAVLDIDHSYNYSGRDSEDWVSSTESIENWSPGNHFAPVLTLDHHPTGEMMHSAGRLALMAEARLAGAEKEEFVSPLLSRFWGRPVKISAWVVLPLGYSGQGSGRYPTAYWTHGFGGNIDSGLEYGMNIRSRMREGEMPPMIWVMLDESIPQGTHEFADSANNGPWGAALTSEFIPYLEAKYHMDARPTGRLLTGHSSGGWATLQIQVNYPKVFGGTWSTSPDSSDFHDFNGVDLYAPNANLYRRPDGSPVPIIRENGKVLATLEQIARMEKVLGDYGGQLASFDWVFSPKGPDGAPLPMFDRRTGNVHPQVVAYWRDHYDLANLVEKNWPSRGADLKGKLHVYVGDEDTFYLDGAVHRLEAVLNRLGADPHFSYLPGRAHFDVYTVEGDTRGLFNQIGGEMYATARPDSGWRPRK
jgi:hypothetical protein